MFANFRIWLKRGIDKWANHYDSLTNQLRHSLEAFGVNLSVFNENRLFAGLMHGGAVGCKNDLSRRPVKKLLNHGRFFV